MNKLIPVHRFKAKFSLCLAQSYRSLNGHRAHDTSNPASSSYHLIFSLTSLPHQRQITGSYGPLTTH